MFGLFDKKKEAEVSLADRIAAKPLAAAGAPQGATAAKPRVPFAGLGSVGAGDMKSAYLSRSELTAERLRDLYDVPGGPVIVFGFVSSDLPMAEIARTVQTASPPDVQVLLISSCGELTHTPGTRSYYMDAKDGRAKVLLQVYSKRMIAQTHMMTIPLHNEDIRRGAVELTPDERIKKIREGIDAQRVPFPVRFDNTFAFIYVDGVTA